MRFMRVNAFLIGLLCASLASVGCGGKDDNSASTSPTSPTITTTLTGNWTGDLMVQTDTAKMTWALSQTPGSSTVTGTVVVALPSGTVLLNAAVAGQLSNATFTYALNVGAGGVPSQPACVGQLTGTAALATGTPSTLTGSFAVASATCTSPVQNSSFILTKT
jgi:hypothetical protein